MRLTRLVALLLTATGVVGCGGGNGSSTAAGPLTGDDVIAAMKAEGTAIVSMHDHQDPADPGTDHGTSGAEDQDIAYEGELDLERDRSIVRMTLEGSDLPPLDVESRVIDGRNYVMDGSWLCPGCGMDGDEPLPTDKWITFDVPAEDHVFDAGADSLNGQLWWLRLVDEPVEPTGDAERATYRVEVPVADVNAHVRVDQDDDEYLPKYQGDVITIEFEADAEGRLWSLDVAYHLDDRASRFTATVDDYGADVTVEAPPADETFEI